MIVDGHCHIGHWKKYFPGLNGEKEDLLKIMAETGIDKAIVFKSDSEDNEEILKSVGEDPQFIYFWWAQLNDPFLKFTKKIYGFKIHPTIENSRVDHFKEHLAYASDNRLPVIIHCGRSHPIASYKYALDVARRYSADLILAHMGGASPALSLKAMAEAQNLKKVSFGIEGIVEPFVLKRGIKLLGPERFIFGSDFPISHPRIYLTMIDLICSEQEKKLILAENILRLLQW
ncbi:MAG TPA: hypothetical protein EYP58_05700 [bacterium (Candidatus Stahlbacteria)]|nr:hypothetical protein [Candidatus Stahlbacteria bacterium]